MRRQKSPAARSDRSSPIERDEVPLRREQRRLRRVISAILVSLGPAALVQACGNQAPPASSSTMSDPDAGDAGKDAHADAGMDALADTGMDAVADTGADALEDADAAAPADASEDCALSGIIVDAGIDVDPACVYTLPCGLPTGLVTMGCDLYAGGAPIGCSLVPEAGCLADAYAPPPDGVIQMECNPCPGGGGRRPCGLLPVRAHRAPTPAGAYFARMAHDEAASVHAFRRMRDELAVLGAPPSLQRAAERSARDEERHARAMARRARALGASVPRPRVRGSGPRALEAIARENAVEGCVEETFGALLVAWQAAHAPSPSLRRTFARIAADEARHAALSWSLARWAEARLDPAAKARVAAARRRAVRALRSPAPAYAGDVAVGRPAPALREALVEGLIRRLALG